MSHTLQIKNLRASVDGKEILKGVDLTVRSGEIHAIMGPNGSGKSTLSYAMMGHPKYQVTEGEVLLDGENILGLSADKRAKKGLFLGFQYPVEVPGVGFANFLRTSYNAVHADKPMAVPEFRKELTANLELVGMDKTMLARNLNEGFSGGEKKRAEILQLATIKPRFAVLDETDSGLDIDALKAVSNAITKVHNPNMGILLITHYQRLLKYVKPQFVHVLVDGRVAVSGGPELALKLEEKGYDWVKEDQKEGRKSAAGVVAQ
jgi:Fe-S cluster assembly ATP-binding protein